MVSAARHLVTLQSELISPSNPSSSQFTHEFTLKHRHATNEKKKTKWSFSGSAVFILQMISISVKAFQAIFKCSMRLRSVFFFFSFSAKFLAVFSAVRFHLFTGVFSVADKMLMFMLNCLLLCTQKPHQHHPFIVFTKHANEMRRPQILNKYIYWNCGRIKAVATAAPQIVPSSRRNSMYAPLYRMKNQRMEKIMRTIGSKRKQWIPSKYDIMMVETEPLA